MNRKNASLLLFLLTAILLNAQTNKWDEEIDALITPLVETNNYSGTVLVARNGKTIYSKGFGLMSREYQLPNTPETKFFLASVSMIFTSAAIMKLEEEGKLSLGDPLSKYLPDFPRGNEITIHHLLSQRSGIPAIGAEGNVDYDSITKYKHTIEKLISYFKHYNLLFEPGKKYNHGRSDYILLAYIIEKITGSTFGQYLNDAIFAPLGMNKTGHYSGETEIIADLAKGYAPKDLYDVESAYQLDWSSKTGHASIYSTTGDLQKFAQAAIENRLLKKESWEKIFTNHGDDVGYGWFIRSHLNRERIQMNGRAPGFSSYLGIYPGENLTVVMLSNNYISLPADIGKSIAAIVLDEKYEPLNLTSHKVDPDFAGKLVGFYQFGENFYRPNFKLEIKYDDGHLVSDWGGLIPIDKGDKQFRAYILRTYWSSVLFVADEKGEIVEMAFDQFKGKKLPR